MSATFNRFSEQLSGIRASVRGSLRSRWFVTSSDKVQQEKAAMSALMVVYLFYLILYILHVSVLLLSVLNQIYLSLAIS